MSTESDQTEEQAIDFAQRLENMLTEVLGQPSDGQYTADPQGARKKRSASYLIKTRDPQGISLTVGGSTILRLSYRYQCSCRDSNSYLQVDESAITLRAESDPAPIIHYDFVRDSHSAIPAAHINIHASNDSATKAMLACGSKSQGKNRRKAFLEKGTFPTFSSPPLPGRRRPIPPRTRRRPTNGNLRIRHRRTAAMAASHRTEPGRIPHPPNQRPCMRIPGHRIPSPLAKRIPRQRHTATTTRTRRHQKSTHQILTPNRPGARKERPGRFRIYGA